MSNFVRIFEPAPIQLGATWYINANRYSSLSSSIAYQNLGYTASGTIGTNTLTASASISNIVFPRQKFKVGSDIYTLASISGATITTVETLTATYSSAALQTIKCAQINDLIDGNHATNATASSQPSYVDSVATAGSFAGLGWDGIGVSSTGDDRLTVTAATAVNNIFSAGGTVLAVVRQTGVGLGAVGGVFNKYNGTTAGWYIANNGSSVGGKFKWRFWYRGSTGLGRWETTSNVIPENGLGIVVLTYDSSSITTAPKIYVNSITDAGMNLVLAPTGVATDDSAVNLSLGINLASGAYPFAGYIMEQACWKRVLSATEISNLMNYYSKYYSVTLS